MSLSSCVSVFLLHSQRISKSSDCHLKESTGTPKISIVIIGIVLVRVRGFENENINGVLMNLNETRFISSGKDACVCTCNYIYSSKT